MWPRSYSILLVADAQQRVPTTNLFTASPQRGSRPLDGDRLSPCPEAIFPLSVSQDSSSTLGMPTEINKENE